MQSFRPARRVSRALILGLSICSALPLSSALAQSAKPVLMVIANQDFHYAEYAAVRATLQARGLEVVVGAGETRLATPQDAATGQPVQPDLALFAAQSEDYSAIVFVGGWGSSQYQYAFEGTYHNSAYQPKREITEEINRLVGDFDAGGKPVAAICHGVTVLAWARVDGVSPLRDRRVVASAGGNPGARLGRTEFPDAELAARWQIELNGAYMRTSASVGNPLSSSDDVIVDGNIITAENFDSASRLSEVLVQTIAGSARD